MTIQPETMRSEKIRVLLVDDHRMVREGIRLLIEQQEDIAVIGEAEDGESGIRLATTLKPDVVVMDIGLPDVSGIEATREILSEAPETRVMSLSIHRDPSFVKEMVAAGARGYVVKDSAFRDLVDGVRTVHEGKSYLSPAVADDPSAAVD